MNIVYHSSVSDEEFKEALEALNTAIAKIDTPAEVARFAAQALLFVGKIAISQVGFGPVIGLAEQLFSDKPELVAILKLFGDAENES